MIMRYWLRAILAGKEVTIVDTVKLDGLTKGTKYQLKGWQMLKEENTELLINGKRVENDYTFIADDEAMKVEITYTFNASELGGKNLVTFEELYDLSNPEEPVKVAEHKDIEDDGQTVLITERIIKIHTTATDKDGNKELEAGKEVTIIDTITLEGLEVGTQYKLVGWQMLKEENAELLPIHHQGHEYQCHILKRLYNLFRSRPKQPFYQQGHLAIR